MNKMNIIYCILVLLLNIRPIFNEIIEYDLDDDYLELDLKCSNTYRFYLQISNNLVGEIVFTIKSSYKLDKNYIDVYEYSSICCFESIFCLRSFLWLPCFFWLIFA